MIDLHLMIVVFNVERIEAFLLGILPLVSPCEFLVDVLKVVEVVVVIVVVSIEVSLSVSTSSVVSS